MHDAANLASLNVGGLLVVGFNIRGRLGGMLGVCAASPNPEWGADLHLALKLVSVSCASGLERIELQEDLFSVQERDRLVTNTANDGLWDYDVRENTMYFSPRWRAMLGYTVDADVPEWRLLVHPDDLAQVQSQLRDHLEGRADLFESVHRMRHASGDWRWIQSRVKGRLDENGRLRRLVGVETDITERKLYEEALFREKESAQITLQSIGDGVITTDANSTIDYINPVAEAFYRDHHAYSEKDVRELLQLKQKIEAGGFITTEKDAVNLGGYLAALEPVSVVPVRMELADAANAVDTMLRVIEERKRSA